VLTAGIAGLVGGSLSMAAGEFVSVSSQRDVEEADLAREREELRAMPDRELAELTGLYAAQGLQVELARRVAEALTARDGLAAHARAELNIDVDALARPIQAAVSSALSFAVGPPCRSSRSCSRRAGCASRSPRRGDGRARRASARLGGAPVLPALVRVVVGGVGAMGLTMAIGAWFGAAT
jgi:VIT1/CCC1 family predicted Fe2+/Mn2+ transporter